MKIKTSELSDEKLDWVVATCEGVDSEAARLFHDEGFYNYSTDWAQGGPIIEREGITIGYERYGARGGTTWDAVKKASHEDTVLWLEYGPTPLIAAMRAYVASKLGEEVDVPEELS